MKGAFNCPHCKTKNACDCNSCRPFIKEGEYINKWTEDGELHICGKCQKIYSPDQSLEEEFKQKIKSNMMDKPEYGKTYLLWREGEFIGEAKFVYDKNIGDAFVSETEQDGQIINHVFVPDSWLLKNEEE